MKASVLIVDDEKPFRVLAEDALTTDGFDVRAAGTLASARAQIEEAVPDVVVLDRRLPDGDGLDFLRDFRREAGSSPLFIMVTAYGDIANAVAAVQAGAVDYLAKPVQPTDLVMKLRKALEVRGLRERLALAKSGKEALRIEPTSAAMRAVIRTLESVSRSLLTPVFLTGASGSGKQYAAELLHAMTHSGRMQEAPFVDVNCAALSSDLIDSELFGHERGAFTDAKAARRGLIEMADGGTLFLDEIAELPEPSQAKLLKFLDSMRFRRLGGQREIDVALRVVVATNHDINALVRRGRFREDLFHRLSVFLIQVPSLSERREEIPALARAFVRRFGTRLNKRIEGLSRQAERALLAYDFPGNVRELSNVIERAVILASGPTVEEHHIILPERAQQSPHPVSFFSVELPVSGHPPTADEVDKAYVLRVLEHTGGRRMAAAQTLGLSYPTFLKRLRDLGIAEED